MWQTVGTIRKSCLCPVSAPKQTAEHRNAARILASAMTCWLIFQLGRRLVQSCCWQLRTEGGYVMFEPEKFRGDSRCIAGFSILPYLQGTSCIQPPQYLPQEYRARVLLELSLSDLCFLPVSMFPL